MKRYYVALRSFLSPKFKQEHGQKWAKLQEKALQESIEQAPKHLKEAQEVVVLEFRKARLGGLTAEESKRLEGLKQRSKREEKP